MNDTIDNDALEGEILLPSRSQEMSPLVAAEINQQIATARKYPRRRDREISDEIMGRAALDEDTASECMYALPRGGKNLTGPSIRFAEIVMASYGNLRVAARFVEIDARDPERAAIIVEGVCLDLQSNVSRIIPVRRSIMTSAKGGRKARMFDADMTNIAVAAGSAIATREAILKVVPKSLWGAAYQRVVRVLQGDAETLSARRVKVIEAFGRRDIKPELVFARIGVRSIEEIGLEQMPQLFGMLTALADGSETAASMFAGLTAVGTVERERANPLQDSHDEETGEVEEHQPATTQTESRPEEQVKHGLHPDPLEEQAKETRGEARTEADRSDPLPQTAKAETSASSPSPSAATQASKSSAGQATGAAPATEDQYLAHARAWFPTFKGNAAGARDRWKAERNLRKTCAVSSQSLEILQKEMDAAVAG